MRFFSTFSVVIALSTMLLSADDRIKVVPNDAARRVDIAIDGKPFTSYIYPTSLKKPVLYPLISARGTTVTRGFPLQPRPGERVDHPHHAGLWFNHGDVNGFDFWNNSDDIEPSRRPHMGSIVHRRVLETKNGSDRGELKTESDWVSADGATLLREVTQFLFSGTSDTRTIERVTQLTARERRVTFRDNKEGTIGIRVARGLEQPSDVPEVFTDSSGKATTVKVLDNTGVTGLYTSSEGLKGDAVWGTRARWVVLNGTVGGERVGLLMLDHPSNAGFPTYWHARGYGLFAANPLGRKVFDEKQPELTLTLEPGQSTTFRHRIVVLSGAPATDRLEGEYRAFAGTAVTRD
jgi:hypothetical protein